jgi:hypothetical protein
MSCGLPSGDAGDSCYTVPWEVLLPAEEVLAGTALFVTSALGGRPRRFATTATGAGTVVGCATAVGCATVAATFPVPF